uniref:Probable sodium/metabolite cotransporter BASS4, chloroplastic n=1 Tax=Tanacetum cinerariifolium TaxID=118510 RepID=A0A699HRV3_TANCI|nr:probable sodium/metabolite cotransporter BASS4, chloroplastic [Tanacetum cinerariifolium]
MAGTVVQPLTNLVSPLTRTFPVRSNIRPFLAINSSLISARGILTRTLIIKNQTNSNNQENVFPEKPTPKLSFSVVVERLFSFASSNVLPLALIGGVALGLANPGPGCLAHTYQLSKVSTCGIFIISGLSLRSEDIGAAAEAWPVGLFGLASILLFTPNLSRIILQLQLQPQEFVTGLALFSCMPTTLSSGVALTRLAGGNCALALAMTVTSSLLAIMILPFSISKLIACGLGASVPTGTLFRRLIVTVLLPLIFGKAIRESFKGLANFADNNRKLLSLLSVLFISWVPWIQVSRSRSLLLMIEPAAFLVAIMMGMLLHLILLVFNAISIRCLCAVSGGSKSIFAKKENSTALLLVASQKALPVLVAVVDQLGATFGEPGLLIIPCVAAHLNQIIVDSFLISFWNKKVQSLGNTKVT